MVAVRHAFQAGKESEWESSPSGLWDTQPAVARQSQTSRFRFELHLKFFFMRLGKGIVLNWIPASLPWHSFKK